jgi:hypothetical protein
MMMAGGRKAIAWARDGALRFSLTASCQDQNGRSPAERSFSLELESCCRPKLKKKNVDDEKGRTRRRKKNPRKLKELVLKSNSEIQSALRD